MTATTLSHRFSSRTLSRREFGTLGSIAGGLILSATLLGCGQSADGNSGGDPTSSGPTSSPSPQPSPPPSPQPSPPPSTGGGSGIVFGPYKDVGINMNWNTNVMSSEVTGASQPVSVLSIMPSKLKTLTWAFATGECGSESWGGISGSAIATANVQAFASAGKQYIISTGGAAGAFTCASPTAFLNFIKSYYSAAMIGVDFDIEAGQSQTDIDNLVADVKAAQASYPNLRFSFTVATLGGNVSPSLGAMGIEVVNSVKSHGLSNYIINLMAMDYGSSAGGNCVTGSNGQCDMGASAVQAAEDLHEQYGIPYNQIEVTPMIGGNDSADETFTLADVKTLSTFALSNGLSGIHFWSFDRDNDCPAGASQPTCNTYGAAGTLGFTNAFLTDLGL